MNALLTNITAGDDSNSGYGSPNTTTVTWNSTSTGDPYTTNVPQTGVPYYVPTPFMIDPFPYTGSPTITIPMEIEEKSDPRWQVQRKQKVNG